MTDFTAPKNAEVKFKFIYKVILHLLLFWEAKKKKNKKSTVEPYKYGNNFIISGIILCK